MKENSGSFSFENPWMCIDAPYPVYYDGIHYRSSKELLFKLLAESGFVDSEIEILISIVSPIQKTHIENTICGFYALDIFFSIPWVSGLKLPAFS